MPKKDNEETKTLKEKATSKETKSKSDAKALRSTKNTSTKPKAKAMAKTSTKKVASTKTTKSTTKKSTTKKTTKTTLKEATTKTKKVATKNVPKIEVVEYYDLPYRYNQTIVRVLYQTPNILFIYWDISDKDRQKYVDSFGENFFNDTIPVLIIHNDTLHYSFEIEIDDFANSWYLHVNDTNCKYTVELGRRPKQNRTIDIPNNYLYVTYSNQIESPNDHVLFDKNLDTVYFKDVKTNIITKTAITSLSFMRMIGRIYNLYDLQTNFKKSEWIDRNHWQLDLKNPSSANPSSTFK